MTQSDGPCEDVRAARGSSHPVSMGRVLRIAARPPVFETASNPPQSRITSGISIRGECSQE
jgi:hypothetical protein